MNKVTVEWFWLYFAYYPVDMAETCTIWLLPLMTIVAVEWLYVTLPCISLILCISKSDLHHRAWLEGFLALMNKIRIGRFWHISLITHHVWPGLAPLDSSRWLLLIDDHGHSWVTLHRISLILRHILIVLVSLDELSDFDLYFSYYPTDKGGDCTIGLYFSYYPTDVAGNCTIELTILTCVGFYHVFPYFKSYPSQTSIIGLASKVYTLWWTKWWLKYFDSKFTYYATVTLVITIIMY